MTGGILFAALLYFAAQASRKYRTEAAPPDPDRWRKGWHYVVLNGLAGPAFGVACFQWALSIAPSGIVLPIVATTPIGTMALSFFLDGEKPSLRSILGAIIAVGGVVALMRL